jgi:hypothetical protein
MIDKIYIPTYKRSNKQITYNNLPKKYKQKVVMVVQEQEKDLYNYDCDFLYVPNEIGIAKTREIISREAGKTRYSVLDDDVTFIRRNEKYFERKRIDENTGLEKLPKGVVPKWLWVETNDSNMDGANRQMNEQDFDDMYKVFDDWMNKGYFHCGHRRSQLPPGHRFTTNTFFNSAHHIDGKVLLEFIDDFEWDYCKVGEDAHFMLYYLTNGYQNRRSDEFGVYAENYQDGGCSDFRDAKYHYTEHEKLRKKFSQYVRTRKIMAQGKHGKNIGEITEYSYNTIKAYRDSQKN